MDINFFIALFAGLAVLGAVGTILSRHPIPAAMNLVLSFLAIGCLYGLLEAHLLAAIQIIVYVGAIMVLIIYTILLMDLRREDIKKSFGIGSIFGLFAGVSWLIVLWLRVVHFSPQEWQAIDGEFGTVVGVAKKLFTQYIFPFEMISLLLLGAIVAALYLAKHDQQAPQQDTEIS